MEHQKRNKKNNKIRTITGTLTIELALKRQKKKLGVSCMN